MNLRTCLIAGVSAAFGLALALMIAPSTGAQVLPRRQGPDSVQDALAPGAKGVGRTDLIDDVPKPAGPNVAARFAAPAATAAPRFQGAVDQRVLYLFDTATGACWRAQAGENWTPAVGPVQGSNAGPVN